MPLSRDEMDDEQWALVTAAITIKQEEASIQDPNQAVLLFKKHWKLLSDRKRVERFVGEESLFRMKQALEAQDKTRADVESRIAELEAKYPEKV